MRHLGIGASHAPLPAMPDEVTGNRDRFEAAGDEDSMLSHAKLAARVVSSILHDSDLRRVGALPVEEALTLLLQGTTSVCPSDFVDLFLYCFSSVSCLFVFLFFFVVFVLAGGYLCERLGKEG